MATRPMEAAEMLDAITGDSPPPLESWTARDWMNLHAQFTLLKAHALRLEKQVKEMKRELESFQEFEDDVRRAVGDLEDR